MNFDRLAFLSSRDHLVGMASIAAEAMPLG
jgi:hypothetical protein